MLALFYAVFDSRFGIDKNWTIWQMGAAGEQTRFKDTSSTMDSSIENVIANISTTINDATEIRMTRSSVPSYSNKDPLHTDTDTSRILRLLRTKTPSQILIAISRVICLACIPPVESLRRARRVGWVRTPINVTLHIEPILVVKSQRLCVGLSGKEKRKGNVGGRIVAEAHT